MINNRKKADAVYGFVTMMVAAFEAGFLDENKLTLAEIHNIAVSHIEDNYTIKMPDIVEQWGDSVAKECGLITQEDKGCTDGY